MNGIKFDDVHSYDDMNLILSNVNIPPATVKTVYVDIPGGDGSLDLTEALGEAKYNDRECSFTFTVFPHENFEEKKKYVSNLLNGKRCRITLDKDPGYYWDGRCSIDEYASEKNLHQIVVGAIVAPYKLKTNLTTVVVPSGENVSGTLTNGRKRAVPTITTTQGARIIFNGATYNVGVGTHKILNIELKSGENYVTVSSAASVSFIYQEGDL